MKTVAVVAANGRTGRVFVERALAAGYRVRAGVHGQPPLGEQANLVQVPCDATNEGEVGQLLQGADAVVSLIGHGRNSPATVQTDAIKVVCRVMQQQGLRRLISLTGTGVRVPGDRPSLLDRLANFAISRIDPARVSDGIAHAKLLQQTDLDWTIVRVLKLGNGEHAGTVQFSLTGPAEPLTPRARAAAAILQLLEPPTYVRQMPIICGTTTEKE